MYYVPPSLIKGFEGKHACIFDSEAFFWTINLLHWISSEKWSPLF